MYKQAQIDHLLYVNNVVLHMYIHILHLYKYIRHTHTLHIRSYIIKFAKPLGLDKLETQLQSHKLTYWVRKSPKKYRNINIAKGLFTSSTKDKELLTTNKLVLKYDTYYNTRKTSWSWRSWSPARPASTKTGPATSQTLQPLSRVVADCQLAITASFLYCSLAMTILVLAVICKLRNRRMVTSDSSRLAPWPPPIEGDAPFLLLDGGHD